MGADNDGRGCSSPEVGERPVVKDSRRRKVMSKRLRCRVSARGQGLSVS